MGRFAVLLTGILGGGENDCKPRGAKRLSVLFELVSEDSPELERLIRRNAIHRLEWSQIGST